MAILKRSKKSILGLDIQLGNIETNISNNATNISSEITRASGAESTLTTNLNTVNSAVTILNADNTTTGSVDKKILDAINPLAATANVYTKTEVDTIAAGKIDTTLALSTVSVGNKVVTQTELNLKANATDVYTKTELDTSLAGKADSATTYTKTEVDTAVATKANATDVYTKTESDALVAPKANSADVYTKTESDTNLTTKLNTTDTVSTVNAGNKIVTQTELATKANVADVYTQSQIDTQNANNLVDDDAISAVTVSNKIATQTELDLKANTADVYTQTQIDTALGNKANASVSGKVGPSLKIVDETNIDDGKVLAYNSTSGNLEYVVAADPAASSINDSSTALDSTWSSTKINTELGTKADSSSVYTQAEVDSKVVASAFGIKYSVADATALNAVTGMAVDELAVNRDDRNVYKYDGTNWVSFYTLDATHNHDDLYYTEAEVDAALALKADTGVSYTKSEADAITATKANASDNGKVGPSLVVVDETNIADGKVLSYNNATSQLEYVAQTADGLINDTTASATTTYSSNKIDTELNTKADAATTYTKSEVDTAVNAKVNTSDVKTAIAVDNKVVTEADIAGKADTTSVYTKSEVDTAVATKANTADVYTKTEIDTSLSTKLNTTDTVTAVNAGNKVVTENEISGFASSANVYTKTEVDAIALPKFDDAVALSSVSAGNKLVTETELTLKVNVSDVKSTISAGNKVVTESDVAASIAASEANAATAPVIVVDRPTMSTKSSVNLDYVFQFSLSKTPHGLVAVNDEITIYNYATNGDSIIFEDISLFEDKHGEISVTLGDVSEETNYAGKTIKVCYLTTETTVTPGTDADHPIIIDAGVDFEAQGAGTTSYALDYSVGNYYRVTFTDGYYTNINHDLSHTNFHANNSTDYQAFHFNNTPSIKSQAWDGFDDEVEYTTYNWTMAFDLSSGSIWNLSFTRNAAVGGGAL